MNPLPGRMQFGEENEKLKFVQVSSAAFLDRFFNYSFRFVNSMQNFDVACAANEDNPRTSFFVLQMNVHWNFRLWVHDTSRFPQTSIQQRPCFHFLRYLFEHT